MRKVFSIIISPKGLLSSELKIRTMGNALAVCNFLNKEFPPEQYIFFSGAGNQPSYTWRNFSGHGSGFLYPSMNKLIKSKYGSNIPQFYDVGLLVVDRAKYAAMGMDTPETAKKTISAHILIHHSKINQA